VSGGISVPKIAERRGNENDRYFLPATRFGYPAIIYKILILLPAK